MDDQMRLDCYLAEEGFAPSRQKAKELIRSGQVFLDGKEVRKASMKIDTDAAPLVEIRGDLLRFVSRGGLKLEEAIRSFEIDLEGMTCMDVGASTGGFTDCMLQHGAARVYAIDVGSGQLDQGLAEDPRVVSLEQTNMRYLKPEDLGTRVDFISVDVSFISLEKILPAAIPFLREKGRIVCLVKPQFEAGRGRINKKGVVKDSRIREKILLDIMDYAQSMGLSPAGLTGSPIRGPEGNQEYLLYLEVSDSDKETGWRESIDQSQVRLLAEDPETKIINTK